ncbi:MAG: M48 family metalloprotease [Polyangiales bacterium]
MVNLGPITTGRVRATTCFTMALMLVACAANPSARRTRRAMSEDEELEIGRQAAAEVEQYMGFAGSEALNAYVSRIGERLMKHSSRSHIAHEFHVVDMKEPNAFALPGGYIYVSRGLLAIMNSEDELAAVLGHEIAHVAGRHSAQREAKSRAWIPLQILAGIGGSAASIVSPGLGDAVASAGQLPASLAIAGYSRKQEEEADRLGQHYTAAEGWDPAAIADAMDALTREQELAGARDPSRMSFFDTHPTTPDRAKKGRSYAKTLSVAAANRIAVDRNAFLGWLDGLVVGESARGGVFVGRRFVHPGLEFAMTFPKGWALENSPSAVLAQPEDESALLALQVAAEGDDPSIVADQIAAQVELSERTSTTIHGYPAVTASARASEGGEEIDVALTWIAKDGLVFQVLGATAADGWDRHRPDFEATAESFRRPTAAELEEVRENRLRLVLAKNGQTVAEIAKQPGNQWTVPQTAAANAMDAGTQLSTDEAIKVSRREPYRE